MFFMKTEIAHAAKIILPLFEGGIFTLCVKCGKELFFEPYELADILRGGVFSSASITCGGCDE